jgi:hypothetical protein
MDQKNKQAILLLKDAVEEMKYVYINSEDDETRTPHSDMINAVNIITNTLLKYTNKNTYDKSEFCKQILEFDY